MVGPLRLPIPFTLSFLYQGQHCQLKQSLYLAALFADRVVWSLLLEQFKVAKKQIDSPSCRRYCLKAQSHFVLLLTLPSCKGQLNCFKNMLLFSMEIPEYAIHSLPVSDGDLKALKLPLLRKCPKSPSSLCSFLGPFSYKSVMLYMERDKRSVTLWCSDIQFGPKINNIGEYCCWEVSSWCLGGFFDVSFAFIITGQIRPHRAAALMLAREDQGTWNTTAMWQQLQIWSCWIFFFFRKFILLCRTYAFASSAPDHFFFPQKNSSNIFS